jgi:flagellar hook-associated protein 2
MVAKVGAAYDTSLKAIVGTDGSIAAATKSANNTIKDLEARKTAISTRLTKIEAMYRAQFTALDTLVAKMKTTQSYLTQQFATKTSS